MQALDRDMVDILSCCSTTGPVRRAVTHVHGRDCETSRSSESGAGLRHARRAYKPTRRGVAEMTVHSPSGSLEVAPLTDVSDTPDLLLSELSCPAPDTSRSSTAGSASSASRKAVSRAGTRTATALAKRAVSQQSRATAPVHQLPRIRSTVEDTIDGALRRADGSTRSVLRRRVERSKPRKRHEKCASSTVSASPSGAISDKEALDSLGTRIVRAGLLSGSGLLHMFSKLHTDVQFRANDLVNGQIIARDTRRPTDHEAFAAITDFVLRYQQNNNAASVISAAPSLDTLVSQFSVLKGLLLARRDCTSRGPLLERLVALAGRFLYSDALYSFLHRQPAFRSQLSMFPESIEDVYRLLQQHNSPSCTEQLFSCALRNFLRFHLYESVNCGAVEALFGYYMRFLRMNRLSVVEAPRSESLGAILTTKLLNGFLKKSSLLETSTHNSLAKDDCQRVDLLFLFTTLSFYAHLYGWEPVSVTKAAMMLFEIRQLAELLDTDKSSLRNVDARYTIVWPAWRFEGKPDVVVSARCKEVDADFAAKIRARYLLPP